MIAFHLLLGLATLVAARAGDQRFSSGPTRVSLIELYTSEGCSSCPPAERWLGMLRNDPGLWQNFVPVAFHVDYWNKLGWPDRFSTREFTQREYDYAGAWGRGSVYTPCFVRDGAEWKPGERSEAPARSAGTLTVDYDDATVRAEFTPAAGAKESPDAYEIHAAILGAGITSKVTRGENSGETLRHEFIALALAQAPLGREVALPLPKVAGLPAEAPAKPGVPRRALAAWVTRRGGLVSVQATGGWLPP